MIRFYNHPRQKVSNLSLKKDGYDSRMDERSTGFTDPILW